MDAKLVVIVGQTASGKSDLAMDLAKRFNGEIICADSRTVYKGMDIGTAKPTKSDQQAVPHHLLDVVEIDEPYTVVNFKQQANDAIRDISGRDKLPIMVGGSGLYVDSVLYDYSFSSNQAERDSKNPRHAVQGSSKRKPLRRNTLVIGLELDRETLQKRIEERVEQMVEDGFSEEVKNLFEGYGNEQLSAFAAPGYQPFVDYLRGRLSLEDAKQKFVQNDLNVAKKQKTWFKRNKSIHWLNNPREAVDLVTTFLNKKR